ncbi:MAG: hypothetical protein WA949_09155 [Phormidesmis sp.]
MTHLCVLHLAGSADSDLYCDISRSYAQGCIRATEDSLLYTFVIAYVTPDRRWRFPDALDRKSIERSISFSFAEAVEILAERKIDVAVPHMFCVPGMTEYRALLSLLNIPYVGERPASMAIAANKPRARAIVAAEGVRVPEGRLIRRKEPFDAIDLALPVVVKPTDADNSVGISLVKAQADYAKALAIAFDCADQVLVEQFVALGREVRCGIVVDAGEMVCLPLKEYRMDAERRPIRTYDDKLKRNEAGEIELAVKEGVHSWAVDLDDPVVPEVWEMARRSHLALGCRHYSLFDFRIDPTGQCWFIEAALYCSFAPGSVLVAMMNAAGTPLKVFFDKMVRQALSE